MTLSRKLLRRLGALLLVGVVAGVAAFGHVVLKRKWAAQRYAAVVARLDAADPHWRLDDLAAESRATPIPDDENLAVALTGVRARMGPPDGERNTRRVELIRDLKPNVRLTPDQWRVVVDGVEANEDALAAALDLTRYPRGRHPIRFAINGIGTLFPHVDQLGTVAHLLDDLRLSAVQRGDADTALRTIHATLNLNRSLDGEPAALSQIMRCRFRRDAVAGLERELGHAQLTDAQLADLARAIDTELRDNLWTVMARGEGAFVDQLLGALQDGLIKPSLIARLGSVMPPPPSKVDQAIEWARDQLGVDFTAERAELLEFTEAANAVGALPWPERQAAVLALPKDDDPSRAEIVRFAISPYTKMFGNLFVDQARLRCAAAAVAVERYRLRHGRWPATLAEVGPLPDDPFTGRPLLLKRLADGVVVYSVGWDGSDDGGRLTEGHAPSFAPNSDIGTRLWDVAARNRPVPKLAP